MYLVSSIYHQQIIDNIKLGIDTTSKIIKVENVDFRVMVFPERTIPRLGMNGVGPDEKHIYILLDPKHPKLYDAINTHIVQTITHEYHHTLRQRTVGSNNTLLESLVSEGLACHFAIEVCKMDTPRYCRVTNLREFEYWNEKAKEDWYETEFDYFDWFVGRTKPRNIGYTIGFNLVNDYLNNHKSETAASLHNAPAKQFVSGNKE